MNRMVKGLVVMAVITALSSVVVLAETKSHRVTFDRDVKVNGTLVEKGTYKVVFDEQSSELMILKGKETIARATARPEKRDRKAESTEIRTVTKGDGFELIGIAFPGDRETIVVGGTRSTGTGGN